MIFSRKALVSASLLTLMGLAVALYGQGTAPSSPLLLLTREGRTPLPTFMVNNQEMVALDELAGVFKFAVREDTVTNAVRVTHRDKSILLTPDQTLVSVAGRLVSLPAPLMRSGRRPPGDGRWLVPVEFINRAFALVHDEPIELRKPSRLLIVGRLQVPRVALHYETVGNDLRVSFDLTPTVGHAIVQEARRLLVRLEADAIDPAIPAPPAQNLLAGVRVLDTKTIELTLGQRFGSYRSSLPTSTPASSRILVDLVPSAPEVTAAPPAPTPPPGATIPGGDPLPGFSARRPTIRTIVIDPGHGGDDAGARGPSGALEKDITLAVARRLKAAIEGRYGIRVLQTRDDDRLIGPDGRAAYANNNKADLFISLHANASRNGGAKGAEIFYLGLDKYGDEARKQAHLEGGVLPVFGGGSRDIELVIWDLAQARHVDQSAVLAGIIEAQLRTTKVDVGTLASQQGPMRGLAGVNMPAVLIELGYLTNPAQERALRSEAYQTLIAQALTDAVAAFRDYSEGNVGETVRGADPSGGTRGPDPSVRRADPLGPPLGTEPPPVAPASFGR
ncbi:MAG TPA: N-acetylmuramoyl-L-alanine amidase [Vicinamibacterales bacterium]